MKIRRSYRLFTFLTLLLLPLLTHAHVHLNKSQPMADEIFSNAPTSVQLWFSANIESAFSKIKVKDAAGQRVDDGDVTTIDNDAKTLQINLKPLSSGNYVVEWNVVSGDGHRIKGDISFKVE